MLICGLCICTYRWHANALNASSMTKEDVLKLRLRMSEEFSLDANAASDEGSRCSLAQRVSLRLNPIHMVAPSLKMRL